MRLMKFNTQNEYTYITQDLVTASITALNRAPTLSKLALFTHQ